MKRLGPQAKKLFEYSSDKKRADREENRKPGMGKKYTFILPTELMKKVKHSAVEQDKTISRWLTEAIKNHLPED